jgi:hypothetical protein
MEIYRPLLSATLVHNSSLLVFFPTPAWASASARTHKVDVTTIMDFAAF